MAGQWNRTVKLLVGDIRSDDLLEPVQQGGDRQLVCYLCIFVHCKVSNSIRHMLNVPIGEQWVGLIKEAVLEQSFETDFGKVFSEDKRQVPVLVQVLTSIHSHSAGDDLNQNRDLPLVLREDFAKICFETLLQYSLLDQSDPLLTNGNIEHVTNGVAHLAMDKDAKITNKLAVTSLLHRFKEVVTSYIADEELHGSVPLPSHRVSEMSFVLKALATLISSLKRSSAGVDKRTWGLVIGLYPDLVRATVTNAEAVATSLQQALQQYTELLQPPAPQAPGISEA